MTSLLVFLSGWLVGALGVIAGLVFCAMADTEPSETGRNPWPPL